VLTVAVADAILSGGSYVDAIRRMGRGYPGAGYGGAFSRWLQADAPQPYNSWGNGAAMRVSPVGFAFATEEEVLHQARLTAEITHNHPEGIKGAQAMALAIYLAPGPATAKKPSGPASTSCLVTTSTAPWMRSGPFMSLMSPVKGVCRRRLLPFSTRIPAKTPSAMLFPWEGIAIPWPV
jgi:hypothetical protein